MFPKVFRASRGGDMSGSRSHTRHRRRGYNTIGVAALMVGLVVWLPATSSAASGDVTPPTAPSNLTATATGPRVDLSWDASTDNVLVTGYILERCQGTAARRSPRSRHRPACRTATTGSPPGPYSYRAKAIDAAGNTSGYSNLAPVNVPDWDAPTPPANVTATPVGSTINLTWTASTDNVGVFKYFVVRCQGVGCTSFSLIVALTTTSYSDTGLNVGSYSYEIVVLDYAAMEPIRTWSPRPSPTPRHQQRPRTSPPRPRARTST